MTMPPSREFMCALLNYRGHRIREAGTPDRRDGI